jgi:hypothetical protein
MNMKRVEGLMTKETISSISPVVLAGAALVRLGWIVILQFVGGVNLADFLHYWLLQLVIGG